MSKEEEISTADPRHVLIIHPGYYDFAGRHPHLSTVPFNRDRGTFLNKVMRIVLNNRVNRNPELRVDSGFVRRKVCVSCPDCANHNCRAALYR